MFQYVFLFQVVAVEIDCGRRDMYVNMVQHTGQPGKLTCPQLGHSPAILLNLVTVCRLLNHCIGGGGGGGYSVVKLHNQP